MAGESARLRALKARERSARLVEYADRYERGADGEPVTAGVLDGLGPRWHRLDDVHWPGRPDANLDHIVVGPAGVFVIDTKNWSGNLDIGPTKIRQNGRSRQHALNGIQLAARNVAHIVEPVAQAPTMPVLCFVRDVPIRGLVGKVMVCSTTNIVARLESLPPVLDDDEIRSIADHLVNSLPAASEPSSEPIRTAVAANKPHPSRQPFGARRVVPKLMACIAAAVGSVYLIAHVDDLLPSSGTAQHDQPIKSGEPAGKDASIHDAPRPDGSR
jgi:hypothetical protein